MLSHSFVLDCLDATGSDTFTHFEVLIDEHRRIQSEGSNRPSRLKQLVPTVGVFHTYLPLRHAFEVYNEKHSLTKRKHIQISFNEIRHILVRRASLVTVSKLRPCCGPNDIELTRSSYSYCVELGASHGDAISRRRRVAGFFTVDKPLCSCRRRR